MNTAQLPTLDDAVNRLLNAAKREIRKSNPDLIVIPPRSVYAKAFAGMIENAGDAASYINMIDAFLAVYAQNQKNGGVSIPDMLDIIADRFRLVLESLEEYERAQIITKKVLS